MRLRHAEPNKTTAALEQTAAVVLGSARFRSFGSAVSAAAAGGSDDLSFLSN